MPSECDVLTRRLRGGQSRLYLTKDRLDLLGAEARLHLADHRVPFRLTLGKVRCERCEPLLFDRPQARGKLGECGIRRLLQRGHGHGKRCLLLDKRVPHPRQLRARQGGLFGDLRRDARSLLCIERRFARPRDHGVVVIWMLRGDLERELVDRAHVDGRHRDARGADWRLRHRAARHRHLERRISRMSYRERSLERVYVQLHLVPRGGAGEELLHARRLPRFLGECAFLRVLERLHMGLVELLEVQRTVELIDE